MRTRIALCLLAIASLLSIAACGGSDSTVDKSGSAAQVGNGAASPITKAELIRRGDAICTRTDKRQRTAFKSYEKEQQTKLTTQTAIERSMRSWAFPPLAAEIQELESLGAPEGDEPVINAILSGLHNALKTAEAKPSILLGTGEGPFTAPDKLAATYGFKACAQAL